MIIIDLIYNLSVLVALSVLSGFIDSRYHSNTSVGKILQGILFGAVAIIGMLYPFILTNGIIFDGRSIVISLCTLFFGPLSGLISSILAVIIRNYLGGGGALMGSLVIAASFLIGCLFHISKIKGKFNVTKTGLYSFGLLVTAAMMGLMLTLPTNFIKEAYKVITATVMIFYPLITMLIGKILLDQEENKNYLDKINKEKKLYLTTLYSIGDGVIATNNRGYINQMNPIAENLTGWAETEAINKPLYEVFKIINEGTRQKVENPVNKVLKEGKIVGLANHTLLIAKDGKEIPIADSGAPIRNENGDIDGVVLVFRDQLKERASQKILEESEAQLKQSQRVARIGYYIFDIKANKWTSSEMLDEIFGIDKNYNRDVEGWLNLVHPNHREEMAAYLTNHILKEKNEFNKEYKILRKSDNAVFWIHGLGSLEFDKSGKLIKMFGTIQDVTERKESQNLIETSLKEKEVLLKEIHHRVKNNFQRIISLIALQTEFIEDQKILNIFEDLQNRLRTMSLIHELMYGTGEFAGVDVKNYIEQLTHYLVKTYSSSGNIKLILELENHSLDLDIIIPCGLITNEIITNSLKYAFPDEAEGCITILFKKVNGEFCMTFSDNGIGIKDKIDFENINTLGLRLLNLLTKQLKGTLEVFQPDKGLQFIIKFKGES